MERQSGAEDGGQHDLVGGHVHLRHTQRGGDIHGLIVECLGNFKGFKLADAGDVVAK